MQPTTDSNKTNRDTTQQNLIELESIKELIRSIPAFGEAKTVMLEALMVFPRAAALPPHYDTEVVQTLCEHFLQHPSDGNSYKQSIKALRTEKREAQRKKKKEAAPTREIYFQLFQNILGPLPRDIFSGKCMVKHDGLWEPAQNFLHRVKSEAYDLKAELELQIPAIDSHYFEFECQQERVFIPNIPTWDGSDRLKEIAGCIKLDGTQTLPSNAVEQFLKAWCAGIFRKMEDPSYQNPVLILKGPQGIGKDVLIDTLTGGFEQWSKDLILSHNDKDNYTQLSRAAVLRIAEFERTSKTDLSTIKDMIFRKYTFLRPSHQPEFRDAQCRASFVASCNTDDIYRDSTGNRRFVVFNVKSIGWSYPRTFDASKQIMAQARELAASNYQVAPMNLDAMAKFLESKTPESMESLSVERWEWEVKEWIKNNPNSAEEIEAREPPWITNEEAVRYGIFDKVTKALGIHLRTLRQHLKSEGLAVNDRPSKNAKKVRGFLLGHLGQTGDTSLDENVPEIDF